VFVNLDDRAPSFDDWMGPIKQMIEEYLTTPRVHHGDLSADVACNWKNYVDNYQEGYHIPLVHKRLARDIRWKEYRVRNVPGGSIHEVEARDGVNQPGLFGWRFPNFMFNTYADGVSFMRVEPAGATNCRIHYSHFRPEGSSAEEYEREVVDYGWEISEEDQWVTPLVQQNLEAGRYDVGPLSPTHEGGLYYFHQLLRAALD
jgi:choline monooxygenase